MLQIEAWCYTTSLKILTFKLTRTSNGLLGWKWTDFGSQPPPGAIYVNRLGERPIRVSNDGHVADFQEGDL